MSHQTAYQTPLSELSTCLGDALSRSKSDLTAHGQSETHFPVSPPDAVAYPTTETQVADILRIANAHGMPVVGWGAGTSLEAQALPVHGGLVVDFSKMNQIIAVEPENMIARVQPGITREELNDYLRATGLFFPVDPGANASIGGMASTRASGTTTVRYGTMRDNVVSMRVALADGRVISTGSDARKSSTGYDLTGLMIGAEGTLGLITELTLRLHGQPDAISAAICGFDSMEQAVTTVIETIQCGVPMARMEFVDPAVVAAFNSQSGADMPLTPHLLIEFNGSEASVAEQAELFGDIARGNGALGFDWASKTEDRNRLWKMRHQAFWSVLQAHPGKTAMVTDVCVPIAALAEAVTETQADIAAAPIDGPILGHVGDGNFHAILMIDPDNAADMAAAQGLSARMVDRALARGGTCSGEHGIGLGKRGYMEREHGAAWDVMGQIKQALDPNNILNPGKLLRN